MSDVIHLCGFMPSHQAEALNLRNRLAWLNSNPEQDEDGIERANITVALRNMEAGYADA